MGDVWQILFVNKLLTVKGGKRLQATCHLWWTEAPQKGQRLSRCLIKIQNDFGERDWRNANHLNGRDETAAWLPAKDGEARCHNGFRSRKNLSPQPSQSDVTCNQVSNQSRASTFYRVLSRKLHSTIQKWECAQCALTTLQTWPQAFLEWKHDLESRPAWFRI